MRLRKLLFYGGRRVKSLHNISLVTDQSILSKQIRLFTDSKPLSYHTTKPTMVDYKKDFSNVNDDIPKEKRFVHKSEVERFIIDCMMKVGAEEERAKMLAANLSEADYVGHFSHGLNRLTVYIKDCKANLCKPNNDPIILKQGPVTGWVDGNNGLGVVVGTFCMSLAIEMAKKNGLGWVVAKGSNHFGICQWYNNIVINHTYMHIVSQLQNEAI